MFTIITEQYAKILRRDYRIRLTSVLLFGVSIAFIIGICALIPSYMLSKEKLASASQDLQSLKTRREESGAARQEKEIFASRDLINKVNSHVSPIALYSVVESIVSARSSGISLTRMSVDTGAATAAKDALGTISVSGVARDRDSLIAFKHNLEKNGRFTKVELPLSDLAKSRNIDFSIKASITLITL